MSVPRPDLHHRLMTVVFCVWLTCTLVACGAASEPAVLAAPTASTGPTALPAPTTEPIVSDDASQSEPATLPTPTAPPDPPAAPEVDPSIDAPASDAPASDAPASEADRSEHVLDPLLPGPADLPDGWTYTRSDEYNGESAQEDCPGTAEFAEFLGWMRRKVVSSDTAGEIEVAVGHVDARVNDVLGTLAGVSKLEQCRESDLDNLRFQVLDTESDVGDLIVAFEVTFPEGRLVWVGAALADGLVATAQFGTPPAPAGDESLAELLAQIALVDTRRPAAVDLRVRCQGRFGPGPLRDVEIGEAESCAGYRDWVADGD